VSSRAENEGLVLRILDAYNRRDLEGMTELLDEQIESHVDPPVANSGDWRGIDGFREMVAAWTEAFSVQISHVRAMEHPDGDHVIADIHQVGVGAASGVEVEMRVGYLFGLRDGRIARFGVYQSLEAARAALRE
jgi:ketosteroid isomerase-like protein